MQVSKKKTSQGDHVKPVFKNITSQAELKREIDKYLKQKELDLENKLVDGIEEAKEDMQREKIRKKEENIERNKAKEYLNTQALEITGYDSKYLNELYDIAEKHPREFNEIMKKSKIDELLKEFDEYKQVKKEEEIEKTRPPDAIAAAIDNFNKRQPAEIGNIVKVNIAQIRAANKKIDNAEIVKKDPHIRVLIENFIDNYNGPKKMSGYLISKHLDDQYGVTFGIQNKAYKAITKYITEHPIKIKLGPAVSVTGGPAAASAPPAPTQDAHGLSGYISGKVIKDVLKRFNVLVGEALSGNTSPEIKAEIFDIVDFLYKNRKITKPQMNQVVRAFRLDKP